MYFLLILAVALLVSSIGFKKYVWFISIGYGFAVAAIGLTLIACFGEFLTFGVALAMLLFVVYGCRLGGYILYRELKSTSYNTKMKTEIKDGKDMKIVAKIGIWVSAALLYACQTSPVLFRAQIYAGTDAFIVIGVLIMAAGIAIETIADLQKNKAKKENPGRFVSTGLYKIVRCPNYFGEMLFWTGVFVSGLNTNGTVLHWIAAVVGYLGIIYVMFGGARRLEMRQNRTYGEDSEYQEYVKSTPIMVPLIPLYSVEKYKWLVA